LGWLGDLRTPTNVFPTKAKGSISSGAGSRRRDCGCLRFVGEGGGVASDECDELVSEEKLSTGELDILRMVEAWQPDPESFIG